jgi:hypothetical protein
MSLTHGGYETAGLLSHRGINKAIVKLSIRFSRLQEVLGFSLTDIIKKLSDGTIRVMPLFNQPDHDSSLKTDVLVLMPFKNELRPIYEDHIQSACRMANLSCRTADDFFRVGEIMHDIWSAIFLSDWIIADCTGRNPNVFYEMGIAHTLGKLVILITQDEEDVPFDICHIRFLSISTLLVK